MTALAAQNLLPGEGGDIELGEVHVLREGCRRGVADGQALAIGRNEIGIRNADARGGAVPGEDDVAVEIDLRQVRKKAVVGIELANIGKLQLLHHIGDPAGAEAFPGEHVYATLAEQRPHGHFDGARVGGRNDADAVVSGNFENLAGKVDGQFQLFLANLGAVRTTERGIGKRIERPTGALRARARRKVSIRRTRGGGDDISHIDTLPGN